MRSIFVALGLGILLAAIGIGRPPAAKPMCADYKTWRKANEKPLQIPTLFASQCLPLSRDQKKLVATDPHTKYFITVYVNKTGEKAMFNGTAFPVGSAIVKEKQAGKENGPVALLTAMVKGAKGLSPKTGDWQFYAADADGNVTASGKQVEHCVACHAPLAKSDFVFRSYLASRAESAC